MSDLTIVRRALPAISREHQRNDRTEAAGSNEAVASSVRSHPCILVIDDESSNFDLFTNIGRKLSADIRTKASVIASVVFADAK